ncbi:MAG TPA: hypothetical protein VI792_04815, partial [Candidatus Eisenbacteria bacterium]
MGLMTQSGWKDWARQWGLAYHAPRFLGTAREWMAGSYRGYLVKLGWLGDRHLEFYALIRFPKGPEPGVIRQRLLADPALAELPGWSKIKPADGQKGSGLVAISNGGAIQLAQGNVVGARPLVVGDSSAMWTRPCPWRRPSVDQLQGWVDKLMVSLAQNARPFEGRCEECGATVGERFVMVNGVPVHLCEPCQQALVQKGQAAAERYEQGEARHALGALAAAAAAVVGGAAWALISFFTERMFALVAIGIALLVGFFYRVAAKKMDFLGQVIGVAFTIAGVLIGDILFFTLLVMKQRPEVG